MKKLLLIIISLIIFFFIATYTTISILSSLKPPAKEPFTSSLAEKMLMDTSTYLLNNAQDGDIVSYTLDARNGEQLYKESQTRQLLTAHGIANAANYLQDTALLDFHKRNIKYLKTLFKPAEKGTYIKSTEENGLINDTVFAVMTLIDSPYAAENKKEIADLGTFLLSMQKDDGTFFMLYPPAQNKLLNAEGEYNLQRFGSGEAALACIKLYTALKDKRYLTCSQKAYSAYYPQIKAKFHPSFGSWHTIAYAHLYEVDKQQKYIDAIRFMSQELIKQQNQSRIDDKERGGFDMQSVWYASAEAVYTESLGYAYRILKATYPQDAERAKQANELGLKHLHSLQDISTKNKNIFGGIRSDEDIYEITVDNNGHTIIALMEYLTRE